MSKLFIVEYPVKGVGLVSTAPASFKDAGAQARELAALNKCAVRIKSVTTSAPAPVGTPAEDAAYEQYAAVQGG